MTADPITFCEQCAFFESTMPGSGLCHRRPPVIVESIMARLIAAKDDDNLNFHTEVLDATQYPGVGTDWFCGDGVPLPTDAAKETDR